MVRLAKEKGIPIPFDSKDYAKCLVSVEHISDEEPTSYMEDEELDELVNWERFLNKMPIFASNLRSVLKFASLR